MEQLVSTDLPSDDFTSFKTWYDNGLSTVGGSGNYYDTILNNNILPCLQFTNKELSDKVHAAIKGESIVLEPVTGEVLKEGEESSTPAVKKCELSGEESVPCTFKMRLSESSGWICVTTTTRERIVSVCDFYTFISYVQKGIIKKEVTDVYWRVAKLRAMMCLSVLSLSLPDTVQ
uniref:Uncharacterized protein n=2 Tax=Amphimedon queenslandica TaxID=400682 RepID=A0A1X7SJ53_AMPQE